MKNLCKFFLALVLAGLCLGCRQTSGDSQDDLPPGSFWAQRLTDNSFYIVQADLMASGAYCEVYVAKDQQNEAVLSKVQAIANEFDGIFGMVSSQFGPPSDVDGNGKILILLLKIGDYTSGSSYTAGYFQPLHSLSGPYYPNSNQKDMIFMHSSYPSEPGDDDFNMTLAHEFQHLVNFNQTYILGGLRQFDVWINEGLSSAAEYLYQKSKTPGTPHITGKIGYYKTDPYNDIRNGVNFVKWTPSYAADPYSSYATVYLFFQWLRIQTDPDLTPFNVYQTIFTSPFMDYSAIPHAVGTYLSLGNGWPEILQNWFKANALCASSGIHGYNNEITGLQDAWYPNTAGGNRNLYPGEGVYVAKSEVEGHTNDTAGNLRYMVIDSERGVIVNINGDEDGGPVPVTLAGMAQEKMAGASATGAKSLSAPPFPLPEKPRPIDRVFRLPE
jgi:hypothetical protein